MSKALFREALIVEKMVHIYCRDSRHWEKGICDSCASILNYAKAKLSKCVYRENKPACRRCAVHCYEKEKRELIIRIMRHSGRRMLFAHPLLAIRHLFKENGKSAVNTSGPHSI